MTVVILAAGLSAGDHPGALACALGTACAVAWAGDGALVIEVGGSRRGPTMLASEAARDCEAALALAEDLPTAAARGRVCHLALEDGPGLDSQLAEAIAAASQVGAAVIAAPAALAGPIADELAIPAVALAADHRTNAPLARLAVAEHHEAGRLVKLAAPLAGAVPVRRARAGLELGGEQGRRLSRVAGAIGTVAGARGGAEASSGRWRAGEGWPRSGSAPPAGASRKGLDHAVRGRARRLLGRAAGERGQVMPLSLAAIVTCLLAATAVLALGGAVAGGARAQRVADLAAVSAARSMRADFPRLFVPAFLPGGIPNPLHISRSRYRARARSAAYEAARENGADPNRIDVGISKLSFAPTRVEVDLIADVPESGGGSEGVEASAEAAILPPLGGGIPLPASGGSAVASGGGYSGPLELRQGEGMRPDVAAAFDRMAAAAAAAGHSLLVNSGFRSDAEQAALFAANPDPQMVAPPGQSLHRCATELDLGPSSAYGWLSANAGRFGFTQRYSWEAWHYGFVAGPEPCSAAGESVAPGGGGGRGSGSDSSRSGAGSGVAAPGLPSFVPERYRDVIAEAAARHDVSGNLLAAQLMAESGFNPYATSPAGAQGIAQFMPATAAAMGLSDPFDAEQAIDAQARLMSDLLGQFGSVQLALAAYNAGPGAVQSCSCVPPYPETQDYVTRILGLMGGSGASLGAAGGAGITDVLDVRLVD